MWWYKKEHNGSAPKASLRAERSNPTLHAMERTGVEKPVVWIAGLLRSARNDVLIFPVLCFLLSSCGFTPLYSKHAPHNQAAVQEALETQIEQIPGRNGQVLRTTLMDGLNPNSISVPPRYRLKVTLAEKEVPVGIQQDRRITRYNIIEESDYILTTMEGKMLVAKGHVRVIGSYDAVDSDFATFVAKQDTIKRVMQEMGLEIKSRVVAAFLKQEKADK